MSDRQKQDADRGRLAKDLLENELLNEILDALDRDIEAGWKGSKPEDHEGRHNAYLMHRITQDFRGRLKRLVATGENATRRGELELD